MKNQQRENFEIESRLTDFQRILEITAVDHSLQEVLDSLVEFTQRQSRDLICSILLLDETGKRLLQGSALDLPEEYNQAIHGILIGPQAGSCGTAACLNEIVIVKDIATNPLWKKYRDIALGFGLKSCWSCPIRDSRGKVLGTFAIYHKRVMEPGRDELDLIKHAAHFAGIAIERKRNEKELKNQTGLHSRNEKYLSALLNHMLDGLITINSQGTIQSANPMAERIFGYELEELAGQNVSILMAEPYRSEHNQYLENYLSSKSPRIIGQSREVTGKRKNGKEFPIELAVSEVQFEHETLFIGTIKDISAKKDFEKKLHLVESIVKNSGDAVFCIRLDNAQFAYANPMACKSLNYSSEELLKRTLFHVDSEFEPDSWRQFQEELHSQKTLSYESRLITRHGDLFPVEITAFLIESEEINYCIAFAKDTTERKKHEGALTQRKEAAEKANAAKSDFLSQMSHEFRTPLNSIMGFGQLLELDPLIQSREDIQIKVKHILGASQHLLDLINEILDLARIESGQIVLNSQPVLLGALIENILELLFPLAQKRGIRFSLKESPRNIWVKADEMRLKQVLFNLISNAIKYNRDEGQVDIRVEQLTTGRILSRITDTGRGIPSEKLNQIFYSFYRLNPDEYNTEGSGIGLPVTKSLLEAMGSSLSVESVVGKGSCFSFELPEVVSENPPSP